MNREIRAPDGRVLTDEEWGELLDKARTQEEISAVIRMLPLPPDEQDFSTPTESPLFSSPN